MPSLFGHLVGFEFVFSYLRPLPRLPPCLCGDLERIDGCCNFIVTLYGRAFLLLSHSNSCRAAVIDFCCFFSTGLFYSLFFTSSCIHFLSLIHQVLISLTVLTAIRGDLPSYVFLFTHPEEKGGYKQDETDFSRSCANPESVNDDIAFRRVQPSVIIFGSRVSHFFRSRQYTLDQAFHILLSLLQSLPAASAEPKDDYSNDSDSEDVAVPISSLSLSMQDIRSAQIHHGFCSDIIVCVQT